MRIAIQGRRNSGGRKGIKSGGKSRPLGKEDIMSPDSGWSGIDNIIRQLPPRFQREVKDFAEFLLQKHSKPVKRKLKLDWAGGLKEYKDKYTSLELQKKSIEWWGD